MWCYHSYFTFSSELGVNNPNVTERAIQLIDTMTMLYSLPEIQAVLFWGFWDGSIWETEAPFYEGENVLVGSKLSY